MLNGLRLTTESGVPVSTSDRTAQSTLYLAADNGGSNYMALWSGSAWVAREVAGTSLVLTGTLTDTKLYDVFCNWSGSAGVLSLGTAWTDNTTRAEALAFQNGIPVKTGDATKRYVGTTRATGTGTTEDSATKRYVWNAYRQVMRPLFVADGTDTWNYSSTTVRQANGATGNKVEFVVGLTTQIEAAVRAAGSLFSSSPVAGIGIDSITAFVAGQTRTSTVDNAAPGGSLTADYKGALAAGYHYAAWLECASAASRADFYGDNGGAFIVSGLSARVPG